MQIKLINASHIPKTGISKRLLLMIMRTFIFLLCTTVFSFNVETTLAQEKVTIEVDKEATIDEVFEIIIDQTKYRFLYPEDLFKGAPKVQLKKGVIRVDKLLNQSISLEKFNIILSENNTIIIKEKTFQHQQQVTGKVVDEAGLPIAGVTVLIKGTNIGVATDFDGTYSIAIPNPENVLLFSAIGFATQEVKVGNQTIINVTLKESISELGEIVLNAGYYNTTKREATGSISKVTASEIEKQPVNNPLQALQARMPGVVITQTSGVAGSGMKIQIRGQNSLRTYNPTNGVVDGNTPLYIVDGVPIASTPIYSSGELLSPSAFGIDPLNTIDPANIESVEILKDADATSIYGSRGANGVVLITTKKGKAGKLDLDIQTSTSVGTVSKMMDVMNTQQYLAMRNEAFANDGTTPGPADYDLNGTWNTNTDNDWQELLIGGSANIYDVNASLSGGSELTSFRVGGSYRNETTVFPGDFGYKKTTANFNLNHTTADKKFNMSLSVNYGLDNNNLFNANLASYAVQLAPNAPIYNENGDLEWAGYTGDRLNPYSYFERSHNSKSKGLISNAVLSYQLIKGLTLSANLGYNDTSTDQIILSPQSAFNPETTILSSTEKLNYSGKNWIVEPQITYQTNFGKSALNILLGTTWQANDTKNFRIKGEGYVSDGLLGNIQAASTKIILTDLETQYRYNAGYGRLGYSFDNKFFLNLTGRRDGSSRFGKGKQWGNFGAVGAAWIFSRENLIKKGLTFLNFGKLRGSYGTTGNDQIGDYGYLSTYSPGSNTYAGQPYLNTTGLANPYYSWEVNKKLEASLDLGFFNDRIQLSTTWYRNRSSNQLVGYNLPAITGYSSVQANLGALIENTGWEFDLSTINIQQPNLNWRTSINLSIPRNKLVSYPGIEESSYANTYVVGQPLSIRKVYQFNGVDPETGFYQVVDVNDDGTINVEDRNVVLDLSRKFYGGFYNQLTYKSFELNFLLEFVKQEAAGSMSLFSTQPGGFYNQLSSVLNDDRWTQTGDISTLQQFTTGFSTPYSQAASSDLSVTDASYIRLKNISLAYNMPKAIIEKLNIKELQIYLQAQNLFTITDYFGFNPESPFLELPPLKIIGAGLKLKF